MEAAFGVRLLRALGSHYHYSPLAQELTGMFWVQGRTLGRQYLHTIPDETETDMLVAWGWNGWMSHQMPRARRHLKRIADDPDKILVAVDPRKSETAERADVHLRLRPGTDALLLKAMIAIIVQRAWYRGDFIAEHVSGFGEIAPLFHEFDARAAIEVCQLDYGQVRDLCKLMTTRNWCIHSDLGLLMNRHSTLASYLEMVLLALCGRIGVRGGNVIPGRLMPLGAHSDERDPRAWRTVTTDFPAIMGVFPPNVLPEEIVSHRPDKIRAVLVSGANPLRSYADTTAYEQAFQQLDLLVTLEVAMSETARLSHYVLPARTAYEKWDTTFFSWTFPEVYFQLRRPVLEPEGDPLEESEILIGLADRLGLVPKIPDALTEAAAGDRMQFAMALMQYAQSEPGAMKMMPFILGKTLGRALGSANLGAVWGLFQVAPRAFREDAARAGFDQGLAMGEQMFRAIMDHPEGLWMGKCDPESNLDALQTPDKLINLVVPEMESWLQGIDAGSESRALELPAEFSLILNAGRHFDYNANTIMRDAAWRDGREGCTLLMHPTDAEKLGLYDRQMVRVITEAGVEQIRLEITESARPGQVVMPHGFGFHFNGEIDGANANRLTKNTRRDPLAGTPWHKFVPCRVEGI